MRPAAAAEILVALPRPEATLGAATAFRSTWVVSSLGTIRELGHEAAYFRNLPREHHETLTTAVAATWIPIDVAVAHYRACDALGLSSDEQIAIGRRVADKMKGTVFGTMVKMAREVGVTPWSFLGRIDRFWNRCGQGGGVETARVGPKEARLRLVACELGSVEYFRNAMSGVLQVGTELFCRQAFVRELPSLRRPMGAAWRVQWA